MKLHLFQDKPIIAFNLWQKPDAPPNQRSIQQRSLKWI